MTKVEINGRTYCVETLIHRIELLTKDVKASAELYRLMLDKIKEEIYEILFELSDGNTYLDVERQKVENNIFEIINKYKGITD